MRVELLFFVGGLAQKQGRKAAADFDDQLRLKMADHAVSDQGIRAIKEMVIEIKTARLLQLASIGNLLILVPEFWKMRSQQIELHRVVHIDRPQVCSADSTAFPVSSECRESVDRSAPVSHGSHAVPKPEKSPEIVPLCRQRGMTAARNCERSITLMFPRSASSASSRRACGAESRSRLTCTESMGVCG